LIALKTRAIELESKAKQAKRMRNYEDAAKFHFEAAKIYKQIGDEKNHKWNLANYYLIKGGNYYFSNQLHEAREEYIKAEKLFLELGLRKPAFKAAFWFVLTFIREEKLRRKYFIPEYFKYAELLLKKYKEFSNYREYVEVKIDLYKRRSIKYRLEGNYELAELWAKRCFEAAKEAYSIFKYNGFVKAAVFNEHMYWNLKAKKFENEKEFEAAAECYRKSAEIISKIDMNTAYDEYINHFKCLAIANKYSKVVFEENIRRAIEFAEKKNDEKQKFYLLGFKYDHFLKFARTIEERIEYLKKAKENYYRAGDISSGKLQEFLLLVNTSQKELISGNYREALGLLNKAIGIAKDVKFPNIIRSPEALEAERYLYTFYLRISEGKFADAADLLDRYLNMSKEMENTRKYKFYEVTKRCIELLSKENLFSKDLFNIEDLLKFVRENKISLNLYKICSLTYSYISLWLNGIRNKEFLEKIKLNIIRNITTEEVAKDLERRIRIQMDIEKYDWLLKLPSPFVERYDYCLYLLENVLEDFRHVVFREFYILLENFLKIIAEFNAKLLWREKWKIELEKYISNKRKPFEKFTFGDLVQSLKLLKKEKAEFCKEIAEETFKLLDKHVEIRNNLTHEFINKLPSINVTEDIPKIMYSLLGSFPTCLSVKDNRKRPWYDVEILWSQLPRRISLYYEEELKRDNCYYIEPNPKIIDNKIRPSVAIPINTETVTHILKIA